VPKGGDQNVYLVVDDLGRNGRVYPETEVETADLETVMPTCSTAKPHPCGRL
jgi:hypothetical protein